MNQHSEKRQHKRFPVIHDMARPVELVFETKNEKTPSPAVLLEISAGGMRLLSFVPMAVGTKILTQIDIPGLAVKPIEGRIVWTSSKEETHKIGVMFTKINKNDFSTIEQMAEDYDSCQDKISAGTVDFCIKNCRYIKLCGNPKKLKG